MEASEQTSVAVKTKYILSEEEKELLNLVAEIMVQIIIKETESECNRLCEDQYERSI